MPIKGVLIFEIISPPINCTFLTRQEKCVWRVRAMRRIVRRREEKPGLDENLNEAFRQYFIDFQSDQLPFTKSMLAGANEDKKMISFHSRIAAKE